MVAIVLEAVMLVSGTSGFLDYGTFLSLIWYFEGFSSIYLFTNEIIWYFRLVGLCIVYGIMGYFLESDQ